MYDVHAHTTQNIIITIIEINQINIIITSDYYRSIIEIYGLVDAIITIKNYYNTHT